MRLEYLLFLCHFLGAKTMLAHILDIFCLTVNVGLFVIPQALVFASVPHHQVHAAQGIKLRQGAAGGRVSLHHRVRAAMIGSGDRLVAVVRSSLDGGPQRLLREATALD